MIAFLSDAGHVPMLQRIVFKLKTSNKCIPYAADGKFSFFLQLNA